LTASSAFLLPLHPSYGQLTSFGGVQAGLLLGVVDFDDIGQGLLDVLLVSVGQLHLLALAFLGRGTLHLPEAGLGRVLEAGG